MSWECVGPVNAWTKTLSDELVGVITLYPRAREYSWELQDCNGEVLSNGAAATFGEAQKACEEAARGRWED